MKPQRSHKVGQDAGFSLVEVTIAMGIVATVLVALMALLPYGMDSIREAKSTQIQARIANEIIGELQMADWGQEPSYPKLANFDGQVRRYDNEGSLLEESADNSKQNTIYKAQIEVSPTRSMELPGMSGSNTGRYLRRVSIKIAYAPGDKEVEFNAKKLPLPYKEYSSEIVKMSRDRIRSR